MLTLKPMFAVGRFSFEVAGGLACAAPSTAVRHTNKNALQEDIVPHITGSVLIVSTKYGT
jgi:hypothetical protein